MGSVFCCLADARLRVQLEPRWASVAHLVELHSHAYSRLAVPCETAMLSWLSVNNTGGACSWPSAVCWREDCCWRHSCWPTTSRLVGGKVNGACMLAVDSSLGWT